MEEKGVLKNVSAGGLNNETNIENGLPPIRPSIDTNYPSFNHSNLNPYNSNQSNFPTFESFGPSEQYISSSLNYINMNAMNTMNTINTMNMAHNNTYKIQNDIISTLSSQIDKLHTQNNELYALLQSVVTEQESLKKYLMGNFLNISKDVVKLRHDLNKNIHTGSDEPFDHPDNMESVDKSKNIIEQKSDKNAEIGNRSTEELQSTSFVTNGEIENTIKITTKDTYESNTKKTKIGSKKTELKNNDMMICSVDDKQYPNQSDECSDVNNKNNDDKLRNILPLLMLSEFFKKSNPDDEDNNNNSDNVSKDLKMPDMNKDIRKTVIIDELKNFEEIVLNNLDDIATQGQKFIDMIDQHNKKVKNTNLSMKNNQYLSPLKESQTRSQLRSRSRSRSQCLESSGTDKNPKMYISFKNGTMHILTRDPSIDDKPDVKKRQRRNIIKSGPQNKRNKSELSRRSNCNNDYEYPSSKIMNLDLINDKEDASQHRAIKYITGDPDSSDDEYWQQYDTLPGESENDPNHKIINIDDVIEKDSDELYTFFGKRYSINPRKLMRLVYPINILNSMIGMKDVKGSIFQFASNFLHANKNNGMLNTAIYGKPGIGKTDLGKILCMIYAALEIVPSARFKLVKANDLIGQYVGHTRQKTKKVLDEAEGGVLFIDEAYALTSGPSSTRDQCPYGKECINVINQELSENRRNLVVIIAGYEHEIKEGFFKINQGLERRFPFRYSLKTYNKNEFKDIFLRMLRLGENLYLYKSSPDGLNEKSNETVTDEDIVELFDDERYFTNCGGDIENLITHIKFANSERSIGKHPKLKNIITKTDLKNGLKMFKYHKTEIADDNWKKMFV